MKRSPDATCARVPLSRQAIVPLGLAAALPVLPVFVTQMPLKAALFELLGPLAGI